MRPPPSTRRVGADPAPDVQAARELAAQLKRVNARADRLAAQVPDVHAWSAEDLTREMRRRHGQAGPPGRGPRTIRCG